MLCLFATNLLTLTCKEGGCRYLDVICVFLTWGSSPGEVCPVERAGSCYNGKNLCSGWCWEGTDEGKVRHCACARARLYITYFLLLSSQCCQVLTHIHTSSILHFTALVVFSRVFIDGWALYFLFYFYLKLSSVAAFSVLFFLHRSNISEKCFQFIQALTVLSITQSLPLQIKSVYRHFVLFSLPAVKSWPTSSLRLTRSRGRKWPLFGHCS